MKNYTHIWPLSINYSFNLLNPFLCESPHRKFHGWRIWTTVAWATLIIQVICQALLYTYMMPIGLFCYCTSPFLWYLSISRHLSPFGVAASKRCPNYHVPHWSALSIHFRSWPLSSSDTFKRTRTNLLLTIWIINWNMQVRANICISVLQSVSPSSSISLFPSLFLSLFYLFLPTYFFCSLFLFLYLSSCYSPLLPTIFLCSCFVFLDKKLHPYLAETKALCNWNSCYETFLPSGIRIFVSSTVTHLSSMN